MTPTRRQAMMLAAAWAASPISDSVAQEGQALAQVREAVSRFAGVAQRTSCLIVADHPTAPWRVAHDSGARLFVGSAVKSFILAQYLREVEAGRLSENQAMAIDDTVRSPSSPVFLELSGKTAARNVLEAMIAHSDNTATDAALAAVGPASVRALIAEAGLTSTAIPESTRRMFSYLVGAPEGDDIGWAGIQKAMSGAMPGPARNAVNDTQTMMSTAEDMVRWYRAALRGAYFRKAETLVEFKRIQAMADAIPAAVPPDTPAYAKGGSIDWNGFHCFCLPGQMIVAKVPVTFCFTVNWNGPDDGVAAVFEAYKASVVSVLQEAALVAGG